MHLDFPINDVPKHRVYLLAKAIRLLKDPDAFTTQLINAGGQRVNRIIYDNECEPVMDIKASIA